MKIFARVTQRELLLQMAKGSFSEAVMNVCTAKLLKRLDGLGELSEDSFCSEPVSNIPMATIVAWVHRCHGVVIFRTEQQIVVGFRDGVMTIHKGGTKDQFIRFVGRKRKPLAKPTEFRLGFNAIGELNWVKEIRLKHKFFDRYKIERAVKKTIRRRIHMLTRGLAGICLKAVAAFEDPIERDNYSPEVMAQYDHVVREISSPDPGGRLVILHGPSGSGKTFMVRGLIQAAEGVRFVLIPSQLVSSFTAPGVAELIMRQKVATCLIIEDADMLLVKRMGDNMNDIASMLNLADGIFGAVADVRIICTTNATKLDVEPALLRSGRLCADIEIPLLTATQASHVYRRLTGTDREFGVVRLSDVYQAARETKS